MCRCVFLRQSANATTNTAAATIIRRASIFRITPTRWLRDTFGEENLVSCVLHMDEKTPHLHATVVPIVTGERKRKSREGEKKYRTQTGPRLSADDVMSWARLSTYQNTYAEAMREFGLQRGVVGSTAKHQSNGEYYR